VSAASAFQAFVLYVRFNRTFIWVLNDSEFDDVVEKFLG
jgi:hypothetical protein